MHKVYLFLAFVGVSIGANAQLDSAKYIAESIDFIAEQNAHYLDKKKSPLPKKAIKKFPGHQFFPVNMSYVIPAKFVKINGGDTVVMKTSADTEKKYIKYAQLHFNVGHSHCHLTVYQSLALREIEEYKDYLFIPFKDKTSGVTTYGGGRYLDIKIPEGNQIMLNFNTAYNPYCAYAEGFFCPIPPAENTLNVEIKAGAMTPLETAH